MKILLLENIHPFAREHLENAGYDVILQKNAYSEDELKKELKGVQALGIRSKTRVTAEIFERFPDLQTVGCFCVGTNQVDLEAAKKKGVVVFNAPFSNTRSVAELILGEIITLARKLGQRNLEMHQGIWNKVSTDCYEVRGKTLGIVGYGNIGTQLSMLAESIGMRVVFYDIVMKLPMGNVRQHVTLENLLKDADFVSLHVPDTVLTRDMIGEKELEIMKKGSFLLNASRGTVVVIPALEKALRSGHLAGAALDVYPEEPEKNVENFKMPLQKIPNVILTPHIGGATEEAQVNIGREVAGLLERFIRYGSTAQSVNFPSVDLPLGHERHRISNIHRNVPGVLKEINRIVSEVGANIEAQSLATDPDVGYLVMDLNHTVPPEMLQAISKLPTSIRTRVHGS